MKSHEYFNGFASCPKGLEELLTQEFRTFGAADVQPQKGGIDFRANSEVLFALFSHSRFAGRIYVEIARGDVEKEKDIYDWGRSLDWRNILEPHHGFKIDVVFYQTQGRGVPFKSKLFLAQTLKDAVCDSFLETHGQRPTVDLKHPDAHFLLALSSGEHAGIYPVRLLLDISGLPLSNRGLRVSAAEASLKENLAAAMVAWSSWVPQQEAFCDFMCGSGTIVLEALQMGLGLPPRFMLMKNAMERNITGQWSWERLPFFSRDFKAMGQKTLRETYNSSLRRLERSQASPLKIFAGDVDLAGLALLKESLKRLGLPNAVQFERADFFKHTPPPGPGVLVMNLPFGQRVGSDLDLEKYYYDVGEKLKADYKGYRAYLLTGRPELRKVIHLKTSHRIPVWHGPFDCRVLGYNLF